MEKDFCTASRHFWSSVRHHGVEAEQYTTNTVSSGNGVLVTPSWNLCEQNTSRASSIPPTRLPLRKKSLETLDLVLIVGHWTSSISTAGAWGFWEFAKPVYMWTWRGLGDRVTWSPVGVTLGERRTRPLIRAVNSLFGCCQSGTLCRKEVGLVSGES